MTVDQGVAPAGVVAHCIVGQLGTAARADFAVFASGFLSARAPDLLAELVEGFLQVSGAHSAAVPGPRASLD